MDWVGELARCAELNKLLARSYFKYQIRLSTNWCRSKNAKTVPDGVIFLLFSKEGKVNSLRSSMNGS